MSGCRGRAGGCYARTGVVGGDGAEGAFSDGQLIEAARRLRVWRAEGEPVMQSKVVELLPRMTSPVWEQVAAARAAHEASKAPTARARKKATEK